jgi:hypothetical protein
MEIDLSQPVIAGQLPPLPTEARIIYQSPAAYYDMSFIHLMTLEKINDKNYILMFWTWHRDNRFKEPRGYWKYTEIILNMKGIHALQRMDIGGLKVAANS